MLRIKVEVFRSISEDSLLALLKELPEIAERVLDGGSAQGSSTTEVRVHDFAQSPGLNRSSHSLVVTIDAKEYQRGVYVDDSSVRAILHQVQGYFQDPKHADVTIVVYVRLAPSFSASSRVI